MKKRYIFLITILIFLTGCYRCTDTDFGLDFYVLGNCTSNNERVSDYCLSAATLHECYCNGTKIAYQDHYCPICEDGVCQGNGTICIDTDNGLDYFQNGTVIVDNIQYYPDYCLNETTLVEEYCLGPTPAYEIYACPLGCTGGNCY